MKIEFDPAKNERNIAERNLSFEMAGEFEWESVDIVEDTRHDYGERRFRAIGFIGDRLHAMIFTQRNDAIRVISLRKANQREIDSYEQEA